MASVVLLLIPFLAIAEGPEIRTFGDPGETSFRFVDHGKTLSIYAVKVPADFIFDELGAIGGPTYSSMEPLTRPVTLTLHQVPIETMMRHMLGAYNYTLHYKDGRLSQVRVMHMIPGRNYKVADPIESLSAWTRIETGATASAPATVDGNGAGARAPAVVDTAPRPREARRRRARERGLDGEGTHGDASDSASAE